MSRRHGAQDRRYRNAIAAPLFFRHPSSLEHDTGGHPERAERIRAIEARLEAREWLGYEVREAPIVPEERLRAVHTDRHVERVREHSREGRPFDLDTPVSPGSWNAALHSAGGACALAEELLAGRAPTGFCALRPPGHHAVPNGAMGFCLFCNVAVAARHALDSLGAERVLIVDWDVHHGNGTEAIFDSSPEVLFASIHQWPFYPGTGALTDAGTGDGEGFTINLPVPAGSGEGDWLGLLEHVVAPAARAFRPDLVLVSAGFDAHRDDPLADCILATESFGHVARAVRELADSVGAPVGAVLEGGYELGALSASVAEAMEGLARGGEPPRVEAGPLVDAAVAQVGRYWPDVRR
ncbi:MAG: histone deacetylase [Actinomycetota bacterium]|nr:histone deacetylase [Actinomycetota bacterium]